MKIQVIHGLGMLLIMLPLFSMGVSYGSPVDWPPLSDLRWILIVIGVLLMFIGRVLHAREVADGE